MRTSIAYLLLSAILLASCSTENDQKLFSKLRSDVSGIDFNNRIETNDSIHILNYEYLYNGGGVSVGNLNGDLLPDVVFSGNLVPSEIYINQGDLKFQNVTKSSGVDTSMIWSTGVNLIDVNQDGLDDIYFCIGGMGNKSEFPNKLYINNGDLSFTESASEYGLDDSGESIQSVFFDYDLDGDLDLYLLTGGGFEKSAINLSPIVDDGSFRNTDRLYRNDFDETLGHAVFTEVSKEAGIRYEGFGLGVSIIDANNDHWPDIYVSNDYISKDLLYINMQNGTFEEKADAYFTHHSHFSMGNDAADINNDGYIDLFTTDMLPEDLKRRKLMSGSFSQEVFQHAKRFGYGEQYMRNMLHLNNGNGTYSEIGQFAGVEMTDWTWSPLFADFDNDGLQDLFVTNGYGKDITDMDFVKYRENESYAFSDINDLKDSVLDSLNKLSPIELPNYIFKNKGNYTFEKKIDSWGLDQISISNGSSYADLDLDGDLDLLVNNINQEAFVYRNNLNSKDSIKANYIQIKLEGTTSNKTAIGALVSLYSNGLKQVRYHQPTRGFQSTSTSVLHFGLGDQQVDSLSVLWSDGSFQIENQLQLNSLNEVRYRNSETQHYKTPIRGLLEKVSLLNHQQKESNHNDYSIQSLLRHSFSNFGPGIAVADLNNDGLEDVFIGGAYGQASTIYYQNSNTSYHSFEIKDSILYEDQGAVLFDADGDGLLDIYVTSGGSERYDGHKAYQDRLYINKSNGFELGELPEFLTSTSSVSAGDFDKDGDLDLFIGGRLTPGHYPHAAPSYVLENKSGNFVDISEAFHADLKNLGMVTSSLWTDYNNDGELDLMIVGELMPITVFVNNNGSFDRVTIDRSSGMWNSIASADFDHDGDMDYVLGNIGLNNHYTATIEHPLELHYADFDSNGSVDLLFSQYEEGDYYPIASLDKLVGQLSLLKKQFLYYSKFAASTTDDLLSFLGDESVQKLKAEVLSTSYLENLGNGQLYLKPLAVEAQLSSVYGILVEDINFDGFMDIVTVGNTTKRAVKYGSIDASYGTVLLNDGKGDFKYVSNRQSGFSVKGEGRSIVKIHNGKDSYILVGVNDSYTNSFKLSSSILKEFYPNKNERSALLTFEDGSVQKVEFSLGSGFLSQSSLSIPISEDVQALTTFDSSGNQIRSLVASEISKQLRIN